MHTNFSFSYSSQCTTINHSSLNPIWSTDILIGILFLLFSSLLCSHCNTENEPKFKKVIQIISPSVTVNSVCPTVLLCQRRLSDPSATNKIMSVRRRSNGSKCIPYTQHWYDCDIECRWRCARAPMQSYELCCFHIQCVGLRM